MTNEIKSRTILNTTKSKLTTELKAVQKLLDSVPDHQESIDRKTLLEKQLISIEKDIKAFRKIAYVSLEHFLPMNLQTYHHLWRRKMIHAPRN